MTIQHMDNFTPYGIGQSARMTNGVYAEANSSLCQLLADPDSNAPAGSIGLRTESTGTLTGARFILSADQTTVGMCQRLWMPFIPVTDIVTNPSTGESPILQFRDALNNTIVTIGIRPNAGMFIMSGGIGGTLIESTAVPVLTANAWWHIEARIEKTSSTSIAYEVRVEGVTVLTGTGTVASSGNFGQVVWATDAFAARQYWWKDIVCWDGSGTYNNNFLGAVVVLSLVPDSDVSANWTRATGSTNFSNVDNSPALDGTEYLTATTPPPAADQYGITNLPEDVTSVKGIMTYARARKTDGGDGNLQISMVSNGDVANGADRPITSAFTFWRDLFETDPDTSAPWIPNAVDLANIRMNRTL